MKGQIISYICSPKYIFERALKGTQIWFSKSIQRYSNIFFQEHYKKHKKKSKLFFKEYKKDFKYFSRSINKMILKYIFKKLKNIFQRS
jgi:hypothetical protein